MNLSPPLPKVIKSQRTGTSEAEAEADRNKGITKQSEHNKQNDNKYMLINSYFKRRWTRFSNQKRDTI